MAWLRKHWIATGLSVLLFLVGVGIGAAPGDESPAESAETAASVPSTVTQQLTVTVRSDQGARDKLAAAQAAVKERQKKLDARAAKLKQREAAAAKRERAVSAKEDRIASSTFGDGTYLVGADIPAGSYVADGGAGDACYWARNTSDNTEIIDNHISTGGQVRVTVFEGELFETRGCGTWSPG